MLSRLKKSRLGKALYLLSRSRLAGLPVRFLARTAQAEVLHPSHLNPVNWRHNAAQNRVLARYARSSRGQP
jgi:hypothetical protein